MKVNGIGALGFKLELFAENKQQIVSQLQQIRKEVNGTVVKVDDFPDVDSIEIQSYEGEQFTVTLENNNGFTKQVILFDGAKWYVWDSKLIGPGSDINLKVLRDNGIKKIIFKIGE